jgi:phage terminase large subunit-like protein
MLTQCESNSLSLVAHRKVLITLQELLIVHIHAATQCRKLERSKTAQPYVFDKFAKIGDATTSPTMKADERTPS